MNIKSYLNVPIALYFIGVIIHLVNTYFLLIGSRPATCWNIWVDSSMLIANPTLMIGLFLRKKWAYYISLPGFAIFGAIQAVSLFFLDALTLKIYITVIITFFLCVLAVYSLIKGWSEIYR